MAGKYVIQNPSLIILALNTQIIKQYENKCITYLCTPFKG